MTIEISAQEESLTAEALMSQATEWAGLSDFGGNDFLIPLKYLLDALNDNPIISPSGRGNMRLFLVMQLIGRLYSEQGWKSHPECLSDDVSAPLIITGIVRSGSTALHRLLALDPRFQTLEHWLSRLPMPRPPRAEWASTREYQICAGILGGQVAEQPILQLAHLMGDPGDAEESQSLMCQSFMSITFGNLASMPAYDEWFWQADQTAAYRRLADNLRLIGSPEPNKTWLLKNPGDTLALDAVLSAFPNARIIQTHRPPMEAMPSLCSMMTGFKTLFESSDYDRAEFARRTCHEWKLALERMAAARARAARPDQFVDVEFHAFRRDPMAAVQKIYDAFKLQLSDVVRDSMQHWLADSGTGHLEHNYSLSDCGLSEDYIRTLFKDYT